MNDCIYFDKEWSRCLEKHHQCHIEQKQCANCQYKETWDFPQRYQESHGIKRRTLDESLHLYFPTSYKFLFVVKL